MSNPGTPYACDLGLCYQTDASCNYEKEKNDFATASAFEDEVGTNYSAYSPSEDSDASANSNEAASPQEFSYTSMPPAVNRVEDAFNFAVAMRTYGGAFDYLAMIEAYLSTMPGQFSDVTIPAHALHEFARHVHAIVFCFNNPGTPDWRVTRFWTWPLLELHLQQQGWIRQSVTEDEIVLRQYY